jgi:hypothetical protein
MYDHTIELSMNMVLISHCAILSPCSVSTEYEMRVHGLLSILTISTVQDTSGGAGASLSRHEPRVTGL